MYEYQQPFQNDNADVVPYHRWHFETNNEYDFLPRSSELNLRHDTQTIKFGFGLFRHCEVGMDFPLIVIYNSESSGLGNPFGLGDTDYSIKYNLHEEKPESAGLQGLALPSGLPWGLSNICSTRNRCRGILAKSSVKKIYHENMIGMRTSP